MKIYCEDIYTEDLSHLTSDQLKEKDIWNTKPILIKNFSVGKNTKGQYVINFKTENHKYLNVEYNMSGSGRIADGNWAYAITISTHEEYEDDGLKLPISRTNIWLEPDNEEEKKLIGGMMCILPEKWEYSLVLIPFEDFYTDEADINIDEFEEESDAGLMIYEIN